MRRRWKVLTAIALFMTAMAGCDACDSPSGPSSLTVEDPTGPIVMQVGQTKQITATARAKGDPTLATFSSNNSPVATVDQFNGLVRCVAVGDAVITVSGGGMQKTVAVTCTPTVLIDVTPTTVPFTHSVGVTACPQRIGTIRVTNTLPVAISLTLSTTNPALTLDAPATNVTASGFLDIAVNFTCSTQTPFTATITIVATNGILTDTRNVTVTANFAR